MPQVQQKPIIHGRDHLPGHPDPIPGLAPTGSNINDIILSLGPDAFWKLDEASGTVAHDSSGNGHDLAAGGGFGPPTWGAAAGPPGTTTAHFHTSASDERLSGTLTAYTNDFTAGIWINQQENPTVFGGEVLGQGTSEHVGTGWDIRIGTDSKFNFIIGGSAHAANSVLTFDVWYFVALVRDSGTWQFYVNGLLQAATSTTSPGTSYGGNTWIGNDAQSSHTTFLHNALLSYGFIVDRPLTSTELLEIYEAGTSPGPGDGDQVFVSDGLGGTHWGQANGNAIADESIVDRHVATGADIDVLKLAHPGGTSSFLRADGTWATPASGSVATDALWDAKGDLAAATGADAAAKVTVGTDGQVLTADSTASTGVKWATSSAGSPASDTSVWMPLTTTVGTDDVLVFDADHQLIPTLTSI